jgi:TIGR01777 family protein
METILISGGTGLIGSAITELLINQGFNVIILTRNTRKYIDRGQVKYVHWDPQRNIIDATVFDHADYLIHLAGEGVADKRWTQNRKNEILQSRVGSAQFLVTCLRKYPNKIKSVLAASAIGWYGPDPAAPNSNPFQESTPSYRDFLGTTCKKWEDALHEFETLNKRLVILRTGIVLSKNGGAYPQFKKCIGPGITAILGSGKQMISWIHINDLASIYSYALMNSSLKGVYNAVAPSPVSNEQLIRNIESIKKRRQIKLHIPEFILKVVLGELSIEVLKSCTVSSAKITNSGFQFKFPSIQQAIDNLELGN